MPLVAFDAVVHTVGPSGTRAIPIEDFYLPPGDTPQVEHPLEHGELIVAIELPALPLAAALALPEVPRPPVVRVRAGVGGGRGRRRGRRGRRVPGSRWAGSGPCRGGPGGPSSAWSARRPRPSAFADAAAAELAPAGRGRDNAFKVALAQRAIVRGTDPGDRREGGHDGSDRPAGARVDGTAKVTGTARYTAEIPLPGLAHAALVGATIPSGRVTRRSSAGRRRGRGRPGGPHPPRTCRKIVGQPHLLPSLVGAPRPGRELLPDAGRRRALRRPAGRAGRRRQPRAGPVRGVPAARSGTRRRPSTTTIDEGRATAYEAERLFGGLMPGRTERGDVEAALAGADVRLDVTYRFAANHHNPLEPSRDDRRLGRRAADALRLDDGHPGQPADRRAPARHAAGRRPGGHPLRRRRVRLQGDGLAARHAGRDGRPARRPAGAAGAHPPADVHLARPPRGAGAAARARRRRGTAG